MAIRNMVLAQMFRLSRILEDLLLYFGEMHFHLTDRITLMAEMLSNDFKGSKEIQFLIKFCFLLGDFNKQVIQFGLFICLLFFISINQTMRKKLLFCQFLIFNIFSLFLCVSSILIVNCPGRYLLAFHIFINLIIIVIPIIEYFQFQFIVLMPSLQVHTENGFYQIFTSFYYKQFYYQMGGGICAQQNLSKLELNTNAFINSLKYYDSEREPVSDYLVDVYSYKTIFIQKKNYKFQSKSQLIKTTAFLTICARCEAGVQPIFHIHSERDIKLKTNYSLFLYAQHLNFSFKSYLESFRAKGVALSTREIFYVLRQLVRAASYLGRKRFWVKSFDPEDIYVSSTYQIKIPLQNIIGHSTEDPQNVIVLQSEKMDSKEVLYLAPQQLLQLKKSRKDVNKNDEISRVFSLGILIMQCYTMLDGAVSYYNYSSYSIDINKLNNDIKSVKDVALAGILSRMLQIDSNKRIKFRQIQVILSKLDESMFVNYLLIE